MTTTNFNNLHVNNSNNQFKKQEYAKINLFSNVHDDGKSSIKNVNKNCQINVTQNNYVQSIKDREVFSYVNLLKNKKN
jgi:hypothetical protein